MKADPRIQGREPRADRHRVTAQPGPPAAPQLRHGVPCGHADAGPLDQERPLRTAENG